MQFDILLVDDNAADATAFTEALQEVRPAATVFWASSGEEAVAFLRQEGRFSEMAPVKLIVLDLNMPGLNGIQTLRLIKRIPAVNLLPVVILSSSGDRGAINSAYSSGASVFFPKLATFEQYLDQVRSLAEHWLHHAELPSVAIQKR